MKKEEEGSEQNEKAQIAEDWCFVCKDGGMLLVCDYKKCRKSYHPDCVGKDDSFLENGTRWTCDWHTCFICHKSSKFRCYVCPEAVCHRCINAAEFVHIRKKKGFCNNCLKLALLVEEKKDIDSDGDQVDFKDLETFEGLFMEYWEIINEKEKFTVEDLRAADGRLKMGKNYNPRADLKRHRKSDRKSDEDVEIISEDDDDYDMDDIEENRQGRKRKRSKWQASRMKRKLQSNKKEFIGWGSKSLIQFLESIGKNPSEKLSQHDVCNTINIYIKEKNLFHPQKKKKVVCDARLRAVLGRKTVNKHTIYDLLESHFAENLEKSEEDEVGYSSEDKDADCLVTCKRKRNSNTNKVSQKKDVVFNIPQICFAAIVPENIKLLYLKRSLILELSKHSETFEGKVIGSFVRVKSGLQDCIKKNYHQLMQVTGIKKCSSGKHDPDIFLQVSDMPNDICISMLSDDDFSEEECDALRDKVKGGVLKKFTVDELEQKARTLHEDITKHSIARELALLQNRIDRANEKGWRRELYEYLERRKLLQSSAEQSRLLQMAPTVVPDITDLIPITGDLKEDDKQGDEEGSPKSIVTGSSEIPADNREGNRTSSGDGAVINKSSPNDGDGNEQAISANTAAKVTEDENKHEYGSSLAVAMQNQTPPDVETGTEKNQEAPAFQPIVLYSSSSSDDDDGNDESNAEIGKKRLEDPQKLMA